MAKVSFTSEEKDRIEKIAGELDGYLDEFFDDARRVLSTEQWNSLACYIRACVRRALEVGALLHGVVDAQSGCSAYKGRGRSVFVKQGLQAWRDSFTPVDDIWHLASVFAVVPGGEKRVLADVATLEVMAANRMFVPLDEQWSALSDPGV